MDNEQLLNSTYQNIQMVLESLPELRKITTDCNLKTLFIEQENDYQTLASKVKARMESLEYPTEDLNNLLKNYSEWMTKLKAYTDRSASHLAEMSIEGYTMGMVQCIQKMHAYNDASKETMHLAQELENLHQKSIENLKKYL